jgi:hypothetical protein
MFLQDAVVCLFVKVNGYGLRVIFVAGFLQDAVGCLFDGACIRKC